MLNIQFNRRGTAEKILDNQKMGLGFLNMKVQVIPMGDKQVGSC